MATYLQWFIFLCAGTALSVVRASKDPKIITAKSGQTVALPCRASNTSPLVEWTRLDLKPEYVLVYRDGYFPSVEQHPSFKNRVDLQDRQMKDGDVSLILKNMTVNDTGTYKCHVQGVKVIKLICMINLTVVDSPGQPGGHRKDGGGKTKSVGLKVGPQFLLYCFFLLLLPLVF